VILDSTITSLIVGLVAVAGLGAFTGLVSYAKDIRFKRPEPNRFRARIPEDERRLLGDDWRDQVWSSR
jgi:hypothetical protein